MRHSHKLEIKLTFVNINRFNILTTGRSEDVGTNELGDETETLQNIKALACRVNVIEVNPCNGGVFFLSDRSSVFETSMLNEC